MGEDPYEELVAHIDHRITLVPTGDDESAPDSVSVMCETCNYAVLIDFDRPDDAFVDESNNATPASA